MPLRGWWCVLCCVYVGCLRSIQRTWASLQVNFPDWRLLTPKIVISCAFIKAGCVVTHSNSEVGYTMLCLVLVVMETNHLHLNPTNASDTTPHQFKLNSFLGLLLLNTVRVKEHKMCLLRIQNVVTYCNRERILCILGMRFGRSLRDSFNQNMSSLTLVHAARNSHIKVARLLGPVGWFIMFLVPQRHWPFNSELKHFHD